MVLLRLLLDPLHSLLEHQGVTLLDRLIFAIRFRGIRRGFLGSGRFWSYDAGIVILELLKLVPIILQLLKDLVADVLLRLGLLLGLLGAAFLPVATLPVFLLLRRLGLLIAGLLLQIVFGLLRGL